MRVLNQRRVQEHACRWSTQRLAAHQERASEQIRAFAVAQSPVYREFHRGLEAAPLAELPILTKALLMERFDDVVTDRRVHLLDAEAYLRGDGARLFRGRYVVMSTSGSTGRRGVFLFSPDEWIRSLAAITRPISWVHEVKPAKKMPHAALIAASAPWHFSARVGRALATRIVPTLRLDAATPIDEMVARLNEWQPETLATYPSVLRELAAAQIDGALKIPLRTIASSAEVLGADTRDAVKRAWGNITLQDTYGATEYAPIATECLHGRKHLFEDGAVIEVVDDAGRAAPPGEAGTRLLLTIFERYTQPLIRYEISDIVRLTGEPCPCGRPFRTIERIEGRQEDILHFDAEPRANSADTLQMIAPSRRQEAIAQREASNTGATSDTSTIAIHPNRIHDTLERFAVTAWQVVHDDAGLCIRLVGANDANLRDAIERSVREMLAAAGAHVPRITVTAVNQLERGATGKAPLILSRRPRSLPLRH
jgi:phenylacetate-CoA ligase